MQDENLYSAIQKNPLFAELSRAQMQKLVSIATEKKFNCGDFLVKEGELAKDLFFIIEGQVEIVKEDKNSHRFHTISHLGVSDSIGEIALFDQGPRSASVKALTSVRVLDIPFDKLNWLAENERSIYKIVLEVAKQVSARLRTTNEVTIAAIEKQLVEYKMRVSMGTFMINSIVALCLFSFVLMGLPYFYKTSMTSSLITIPVTFGFLISFLFIIKYSDLPREAFGITTFKWKQSVVEALFFTFFACIITLIIKWIFIHTFSYYKNHHVFGILDDMKQSDGLIPFSSLWWLFLLVYCFLTSPLQELLSRGGMQGPLEIFLTGKHKKLKAILVSNLMFSTAHLFLTLKITLLVFSAGLYFGWLYSRHKNLLGVTLAHALLGVWGLIIVGF